MKCNKCGVENKEGALFCKGCGNELSKKVETKDINKVNAFEDMDICLATVSNVIKDMENCLKVTSEMVNILYEKFEQVKKQYHPDDGEIKSIRTKISQLEDENKILKKQTIVQQDVIEDLKRQLQSGVVCPKCKKHYKEKVMFCSDCGTKLS